LQLAEGNDVLDELRWPEGLRSEIERLLVAGQWTCNWQKLANSIVIDWLPVDGL